MFAVSDFQFYFQSMIRRRWRHWEQTAADWSVTLVMSQAKSVVSVTLNIAKLPTHKLSESVG